MISQRTDVQLVSSAALLEELADVLMRPSVAGRLALIGKTAQAVLTDYLDVVDIASTTEVPRVVPDDADDDHVIAAAVSGSADLIVSGDGDLLRIGSHRGIRIVSAAEAAETLETGDAPDLEMSPGRPRK